MIVETSTQVELDMLPILLPTTVFCLTWIKLEQGGYMSDFQTWGQYWYNRFWAQPFVKFQTVLDKANNKTQITKEFMSQGRTVLALIPRRKFENHGNVISLPFDDKVIGVITVKTKLIISKRDGSPHLTSMTMVVNKSRDSLYW